MTSMHPSSVARAERFLWHSARLLERMRFERLFRGADSRLVVASLHGYQNLDGGFGQALEPDFRGPVSQPLAVEFALRVLDECGQFDAALVEPALGFLLRIRPSDGGVPNVLNNAVDYPRAPWWQPDPAQPSSLLPSASIAGLLHKRRVAHVWRDSASEFCWQAIARIPGRIRARTTRLASLQIAYDVRAALLFLDHVPERARAERCAEELGATLLAAGMIELDPSKPSEIAAPLEFASEAHTLARRWFDDAVIERGLEILGASQEQDGGFPIGWQVWTPLAGLEWRGAQTIERLKTLRSYGKLDDQTAS